MILSFILAGVIDHVRSTVWNVLYWSIVHYTHYYLFLFNQTSCVVDIFVFCFHCSRRHSSGERFSKSRKKDTVKRIPIARKSNNNPHDLILVLARHRSRVSWIFSVYNFCEAKMLNEMLQMNVFATEKRGFWRSGYFLLLYFFSGNRLAT